MSLLGGILGGSGGGGGLLGGILGGGGGGGLLDGILGGGKGGGLGGIAQKLLDPLGILGGNQKQGMSDETKEMMDMMKEMIQELLSMVKDQQGAEGASVEGTESAAEGASQGNQPMSIFGGAGDDTISIG